MFQILVGTNFKFMEKRRVAYLLSVLLLLASIGSLIAHGGPEIKDVLLLFIYLELGAMVGIYFKTKRLPVRYLIYIAVTALTRVLAIEKSQVVLRGESRDGTVLFFPKTLYELFGKGKDGGPTGWSWGGAWIWVNPDRRRGDSNGPVWDEGAMLSAVTVRVKVSVSLNAGRPLSVTSTVSVYWGVVSWSSSFWSFTVISPVLTASFLAAAGPALAHAAARPTTERAITASRLRPCQKRNWNTT